MTRNLLIVDDEPEIVEGLVDILKELDDLVLYTAYNAKEALNIMEAATIDIIVADIKMPGMSGLELCENIEERWPETRIIFLSGVRDFDTIYRSIRNPSVRYLTKMEPDSKIKQTVLQVMRETDEQRRQKHLSDIVNRTFPQTFISELSGDGKEPDVVEGICSYISKNLNGDLSMTALGQVVGFNPYYLSHIFKEKTGINLSAYIMNLRMNTAHELVIGSNRKIQEIASMVGYDSSHSFIRAYQKAYGMSPVEHRQENRGKK